jgi:hypothetical protein
MLLSDQEFNRAEKIFFVDPRHILTAGTPFSAQPVPDKTKQDFEYTSGLDAHHHGGAQRDLSGVGSMRRKKGTFPLSGHIDTESPGIGCAWLIASKFARGLIHIAIKCVAINGGCAGV